MPKKSKGQSDYRPRSQGNGDIHPNGIPRDRAAEPASHISDETTATRGLFESSKAPRIGDFSEILQFLEENPVCPAPIRDLPFVDPIADLVIEHNPEKAPTRGDENQHPLNPVQIVQAGIHARESSDDDFVVGKLELDEERTAVLSGQGRKKTKYKKSKEITSTQVEIKKSEAKPPPYTILARSRETVQGNLLSPVLDASRDDSFEDETDTLSENPTTLSTHDTSHHGAKNWKAKRRFQLKGEIKSNPIERQTAAFLVNAMQSAIAEGDDPIENNQLVTPRTADSETGKNVYSISPQVHKYPSATFRKFLNRDISGRNLSFRVALFLKFPEDQFTLSQTITPRGHSYAESGVHVFIDYSNIWIMFVDYMNTLAGQKVPNSLRNLHFESLVFLLERGRPTSKRVLAGSLPKLPAFEIAEAIGYETNILEKVFKDKVSIPRSKRMFSSQGIVEQSHGSSSHGSKSFAQRTLGVGLPVYSTSAPDVTSGSPRSSPEKWCEQAVDEILQMKMMESLLDVTEPSTMVLATGDGAAAEFSDGFVRILERTLQRGWKVELVSWRKSLHGVYRDPSWLGNRLPDQFRIIYIDEWAEYLIDVQNT